MNIWFMRTQLLVYFLLLFAAVHAYSDYSFSTYVKINDDGSAHITEKSIFLFETTEERRAFEINMNLGQSTILEWRKFSDNIRFHFKGRISNTKITAKREFAVSFDAGAVIVDYDLGPIFALSNVSSRRTIFTLTPDVMAFERTATGQTTLGNNYQIQFEYPKDAELLKAAPVYEKEENVITWKGPIAGNWDFEYAREIELSQEVSEFFLSTYRKATDSLPIILLSAFSLLVLFVLIKFRRN